MDHNINLSIILPVYQVEEYIEECIISIKKISNLNYELIVIDDGTRDNSINIIEDLCHRNTNVRIIHQCNSGLSAARNVGLKYATGKYIWFVDSDDFIIPENIGKLLNSSNGEDILIGNFYIYKDNRSRVLNKHPLSRNVIMSGRDAFEKYYLKNIYTVVWRCLYRREFLKDESLQFHSGITFEDIEWTPRVLLQARNVFYTNVPIYCYRIRRNSIINSDFTIKKYNDILKVSDLLDNYKNLINADKHLVSVLDKSVCFFLFMAYYKSINVSDLFDTGELIKRIGLKKYKGFKYTLLYYLHIISPSLLKKLLRLKFQ